MNITNDKTVAVTPPMGWNSYDCFGITVTEEEVKAYAIYMAENLLKHGWEYVVVDMGWYITDYDKDELWAPVGRMEMDVYGRLWPAPNRFPSSTAGKGFKPLADYIHSLGLKFGVHIMRGISQQAVDANTVVLGTDCRADDVADQNSRCEWCSYSCGIDPSGKGAQAWYDSVIGLLASWDVDFIKADDLSYPYHEEEIELVKQAVAKCSRDILLSLSPGPAPIENASHILQNANMWRVSADFWDRWEDLYNAFDLAHQWSGLGDSGHWPDLDMLPFSTISIRQHPLNAPERRSRFSTEEQITLMTLWCIFRSPLMLGGHLPGNHETDLKLITNDEVLAVLKNSRKNRQLCRSDSQVVWTAEADRNSHYLALFNLSADTEALSFDLSCISQEPRRYSTRDLWQQKDMGTTSTKLTADVPGHGARLFKVSEVH